jgi:hypothetical protein
LLHSFKKTLQASREYCDTAGDLDRLRPAIHACHELPRHVLAQVERSRSPVYRDGGFRADGYSLSERPEGNHVIVMQGSATYVLPPYLLVYVLPP